MYSPFVSSVITTWNTLSNHIKHSSSISAFTTVPFFGGSCIIILLATTTKKTRRNCTCTCAQVCVTTNTNHVRRTCLHAKVHCCTKAVVTPADRARSIFVQFSENLTLHRYIPPCSNYSRLELTAWPNGCTILLLAEDRQTKIFVVWLSSS